MLISWIQVWDMARGHKEQDLRLWVAWFKAHTSATEKAQMTQQNKQLAMTNNKVDELAKGSATLDGAEFAKQVATGAVKVRKRMYASIKYAATFHCEVSWSTWKRSLKR